MGATRRPFAKHFARTLFLRVPRTDWAAITTGHKTEFRSFQRPRQASARNFDCPTPVVAYSYAKHRVEPYTALMVLEEAFMETLGAIGPESLAREGFETRADYRRYWRRRHTSSGWLPLSEVSVYRIRPWTPDDHRAMGDVLLHRLYGEFLDGPST